VIGLLAACAPVAPPVGEAPVAAEVWVEHATEAGGVLVLQTTWDPSGSVDLPEPAAKGLQFAAPGEPERERLGRREVLTVRWPFSASSGSYEIPSLAVTWDGPAEDLEIHTDPLFVDLGVPPPRPGEIADIRDPSRVWTIPWAGLIATMAVTGLLGAGIGVAFRLGRRSGPVVVPPEPPDVVAIRRWEAVRSDPALDDMAKAIQLARIWREYAEAVLGFPATAWTTTEILARLGTMAHLPEGNVPRARRLLRATDRVKFAGEQARGDLFEELDADLRAFVGTTRPHAWSPP
jgi:hypothetical protein